MNVIQFLFIKNNTLLFFRTYSFLCLLRKLINHFHFIIRLIIRAGN